jgi:hypothetical protein
MPLQFSRQTTQPAFAIGIAQRHSGAHAGSVLVAMKIVAFNHRPAHALRKRRPECRFAAPRDTHDYDA